MLREVNRSDLESIVTRKLLPPGWQLEYQPIVGSTMDLAREAARGARPGRTVFLCDHQLQGRGRRGRSWEAPPGRALLFTVLLRGDELPIHQTMLVAIAVTEALEQRTGLSPAIKWPNDLLVNDAKLAGVLTESYSAATGSYVLVGCGLNVNQEPTELELLGRAATSVRIATGAGPVDRGRLLGAIMHRIDGWLGIPSLERIPAVRLAWEHRLWRRGARIRLREAGEQFEALLLAVDSDGALLVRLDSGAIRRILTGELLLELDEPPGERRYSPRVSD